MPDLRRRLLDTSLEQIASGGLADLSLREVARRAGVSHQAPYHHFDDRAALLDALAEEGYRGLALALVSVDATPCDTVAAWIRWALDHEAHYRVMFRPELAARPGDWVGPAAEVWSRLVDVVLRRIEAGSVAPVDAEAAVVHLYATAHGTAVLFLDGTFLPHGSRLDASALADAVARQLPG